jgi:hypothetical protein
MNIFISYSYDDSKYAKLVEEALSRDGHSIISHDLKFKVGDNWIKRIDDILKRVDATIIMLSKTVLNSEFALQEIKSIALNELTSEKRKVVPIILDDSPIPGYLSVYRYFDFNKNIDLELNDLRQSLKGNSIEGKKVKIDNKKRNAQFSEDLKKALKEGKLTLVCGAGTSIGAGIPSWNALLSKLLESMINQMSKNEIVSLDSVNSFEIQKRLGPSSLVMGKYLKSNLGKDFLTELRDALYSDNPLTCDIIDAIIEVSRPQRDGRPLDSIVTFNFDALVEENLELANIKYKAIHKEGIRHNFNELPIYHVHGYLPRKGKLDIETEIVFSEDTYHTQFIDPYSWSNLIQLNKLNQNTCLFIGLSMTDPNLRRLLDVAVRKDPSKKLNHYMIKKTPDLKKENPNIEDLLMFLEEQDANDLGLNVLWVDNFGEVPSILKSLTFP